MPHRSELTFCLLLFKIHIRGGSVLVLQDPGLNTEESRANNFSLLVALDSNGGAKGDVFLDDGVSMNIARYSLLSRLYTDLLCHPQHLSTLHGKSKSVWVATLKAGSGA